MYAERRQLLIDEILTGPLKLANIGPIRLGDRCCFWGIASEVYRRETGIGEWIPRDGFYRDQLMLDTPGDHPVDRDGHLWPQAEVNEWFGFDEKKMLDATVCLSDAGCDQKPLDKVMIEWLNAQP